MDGIPSIIAKIHNIVVEKRILPNAISLESIR